LRRGSIVAGAILVSNFWCPLALEHGEWNVSSGKKANGRPIKYPEERNLYWQCEKCLFAK
jgi:hypothetical protein